MPKPKRKPAGRPALPLDQRSRNVNTSLRAEIYRWLEEIGGGSASRGARVAVEMAYAAREKPTLDDRISWAVEEARAGIEG